MTLTTPLPIVHFHTHKSTHFIGFELSTICKMREYSL